MDKIRVIISDDHPVVRQGLTSMLARYENIDIIGETSSGQSTITEVSRLKPDVLLLDIRLPDISGLDIIDEILKESPNTKIIVLTTYGREGYFNKAVQAGVHAYLLKDTAHRDLAKAINDVYQGKKVISPDLITKFWNKLGQKKSSNKHLSEEEITILKLIADGATNQQISQEFYWSEVSVKRKIADIYKKLNVTRRTEAVAKAIREKYI